MIQLQLSAGPPQPSPSSVPSPEPTFPDPPLITPTYQPPFDTATLKLTSLLLLIQAYETYLSDLSKTKHSLICIANLLTTLPHDQHDIYSPKVLSLATEYRKLESTHHDMHKQDQKRLDLLYLLLSSSHTLSFSISWRRTLRIY